nr:MAG: polyprotein [Wenzhou shrew hepacivirus 1]
MERPSRIPVLRQRLVRQRQSQAPSPPRRPRRYVAGVRRSTERGTKKTRSDPSYWRRAGQGMALAARDLAGVCLLSPPMAARDDPRNRSHGFGHLIDGTLGFITDFVQRTPVVGRAAGLACRAVCRVVRAAEDVVTGMTSWVGLYLLILACVTPVAGLNVLTNCCADSEVKYCTEVFCYHKPGCVICQVDSNSTVCWLPYNTISSVHPDHPGTDTWLLHHLNLAAAGFLVCDAGQAGELCALAIMLVMEAPLSVVGLRLNTTADCWLKTHQALDPGLSGFWGWVTQSAPVWTLLADIAVKIPPALVTLASFQHWLFLAVLLMAAVKGNWLRAVCMLLLYVEASTASCAGDVSLYTHGCNCSVLMQPPLCPRHDMTNYTCWSPTWSQKFLHFPNATVQKVVNEATWIIVTRHKAWGCVHDNGTCCALRRVPAFCSGCSSDCTWQDPRMTFEACATTPYVTTACYPYTNGSCSAWTMAAIMRDSNHSVPFTLWWGNQQWTIYLRNVRPDLPPGRWARLPGVPPLSKAAWLRVPKGFYSEVRDLSSGLITKTMDEEWQMKYSGPWVSASYRLLHPLVVMLMMLCTGGHWSILLYLAYLYLPTAAGLPTQLYAALAASEHEWWLDRILVFAFVMKYGRTSSPWVSASLSTSIFLTFLNGVDCSIMGMAACVFRQMTVLEQAAFVYHSTSIGLAAWLAAWGILLLLAGGSYVFLPRLTLLYSYLGCRLEALAWNALRSPPLLITLLSFPLALRDVILLLAVAWVFLHSLLAIIVQLTPLGSVPRVQTALRVLSRWTWTDGLKRMVLWIAGEKGIFLFEHMNQTQHCPKLNIMDPAFPFKTRVVTFKKIGEGLACGDTYHGLPVFGRCHDFLMAGVGDLPPGWSYTAPISIKKKGGRGRFKTLGISLLGRDTSSPSGSIAVIGSAASRFMGFATGPYLATVCHGSKRRTLATPEGPLPPISWDPSLDIALYPRPRHMHPLERCYACTTGWLVSRCGNLISTSKVHDKWAVTSVFSLSEAKGSSGSPILCKCGKYLGMFRAVRSMRGVVTELIVNEAEISATATSAPPEATPIPEVPAEGQKRVELLIAPTGSGKSTKVPMHYYGLGHRVLVLEPSVASTLNIGKYVEQAFQVRPNVYASEYSQNAGSRLTYSTYGRFLASGGSVSNFDVVICDECHSLDATTVLGIGAALADFDLNQNSKLCVLATATPAGHVMYPHKDITEHKLNSEGDIDYYGSKVKSSLLKTGRHLIFCHSKANCESLAETLRRANIRAVAYYRGISIKVIPESGDVVVVATDALMSGYTGDFDSVYDCRMGTEAVARITMDPTVEFSLKTGPISDVVAAQRRGRTGRGRPGEYHYIPCDTTPGGVVSLATIFEAYDSGLAYFGSNPTDITRWMEMYQTTPHLPTLVGDFRAVSEFFSLLPKPKVQTVEKVKTIVDDLAYMHSVALELALECGAAPCDEEGTCRELWDILNGTKPFPILFRLGCEPKKQFIHTMSDRLAVAFVEECNLLANVSVLGAAAAALFMVIDQMGSLVIVETWEIVGGSEPIVGTQQLSELWDFQEECDMSYVADYYGACVEQVRNMANSIANWWASSDGQITQVFVGEIFLPPFLSALQAVAGLFVLREAPAVGCFLGGLSGFLSPLPLKTTLFLSCLGSALAATMATQRAALGFGLLSAVGAVTAYTGLANILTSLFTCYSSSVATCLVTLKLMSGEIPTAQELISLTAVLVNPGGGLVGVAAGIVIAYATASSSTAWMNRLLSMLSRQVVSDKYFVQDSDIRPKIIKALEKMTPWQLLCNLADWLRKPEEEVCAATFSGAMAELWTSLCVWATYVKEIILGAVNRVVALPAVPVLGCDKPYKGLWMGEGMVTVRCRCGKFLAFKVECGRAKPIDVPFGCRAWAGGVPINNTLRGNPIPAPRDWTTMVVPVGPHAYARYRKRRAWLTGETTITLESTSEHDLAVPCAVPPVAAAVAIDDVQVHPYVGSEWRCCYYATTIRIKALSADEWSRVELPFEFDSGWCNTRGVPLQVTQWQKHVDKTWILVPNKQVKDPYWTPALLDNYAAERRILEEGLEAMKKGAAVKQGLSVREEAIIPGMPRAPSPVPVGERKLPPDSSRRVVSRSAQPTTRRARAPPPSIASTATSMPPLEDGSDDPFLNEYVTCESPPPEHQRLAPITQQDLEEAGTKVPSTIIGQEDMPNPHLTLLRSNNANFIARDSGATNAVYPEVEFRGPQQSPKEISLAMALEPPPKRPNPFRDDSSEDEAIIGAAIQSAMPSVIRLSGGSSSSSSTSIETMDDFLQRTGGGSWETVAPKSIRKKFANKPGRVSGVKSGIRQTEKNPPPFGRNPLTPPPPCKSDESWSTVPSDTPPKPLWGKDPAYVNASFAFTAVHTPGGKPKRPYSQTQNLAPPGEKRQLVTTSHDDTAGVALAKQILSEREPSKDVSPSIRPPMVPMPHIAPPRLPEGWVDKAKTWAKRAWKGSKALVHEIHWYGDTPVWGPITPEVEMQLEEWDRQRFQVAAGDSDNIVPREPPELWIPPGRLEFYNSGLDPTGSPRTERVNVLECINSAYDPSCEETLCSQSYVWTPDFRFKGIRRALNSAVRVATMGLIRERGLVYQTTRQSANERISKVTFHRTDNKPHYPHYVKYCIEARTRASTVSARKWTWDEVLEHTPSKTARSFVTGRTKASYAHSWARRTVDQIVKDLGQGVISAPYNEVTIMPKEEVFIETPEKKSHKPARLIAYPHLEMRLAEKFVLGDLGPKVAKAVCGREYGFLYNPHQRVQQLLRLWGEKDRPMGFACDTVCFDSTITPGDVAEECAIYMAAATDPVWAREIATLHKLLYQGGPMISQDGRYLGIRNCRASGVFTTSSSNTITCWIKAHAAADTVRLRNPSFLICGDDCVCVCESEGMESDSRKLAEFAAVMKGLGAPQGEVPTPCYSLEMITSCSSNVSVAMVPTGKYHYLTRDPRIPFGRCSREARNANPVASWVGNMIQHYPALWCSRVLAVQLVEYLLAVDTPATLEFSWHGSRFAIPTEKLPYILQALHGKEIWSIGQYTPFEVQRTTKALKDCTMPPLRSWKRRARQAVASARRRGGVVKLMADTLLGWSSCKKVELSEELVRPWRNVPFFDPYAPAHLEPKKLRKTWLLVVVALGVTVGWAVGGLLARLF